MSFGENLQFLRKKQNITQEQVAEQLNVSRQSVSKWESDAAYPEMDKLLTLCDMFHCDLDTLMRGSAEKSSAVDTCNYDAHMNSFSKAVSGSIGLILFGVFLTSVSEGLGWPEAVSALLLMTMVMIAVVILITSGIRHGHFVEKHPYIEPFYKEEEIERFENLFPILIAVPIGMILLGVIWLIVVDEIGLPLPAGCSEELYHSVFLLLLAAAVTTIIYAGMQKSKYEIKQYNKENDPSPEAKKRNEKIERWCGVIMLIATLLFLLSLGWEMGGYMRAKNAGIDWSWKSSVVAFSWIVFPVGGIVCGIVSIILGKKEENSEV